MTAVLQDYTFDTLIKRVQREFGDTDDTSALYTEIKDKINDAIQQLWQAKIFWPWSLKPINFNVAAQFTNATASVTNDSVTVNFTAALPASFDVLTHKWTVEFSGDADNEYIVAVKNGATQITLDGKYIGPTAAGVSATFKQSYIELPADFALIQSLKASVLALSKLIYKDTWEFQHMISQRLLIPDTSFVVYYTVLMDPLGSETNRQYITFWPRITSLTRIDGTYFITPKGLVDTGDIVPVPRSFRVLILYKAMQLLAVKLADYERASFYGAEIQKMEAAINQMKRFVSDDDSLLIGSLDPTGLVAHSGNIPVT